MHLSELLLGVYPRSGFMCILLCVFVLMHISYLSELLLGDSPRSGMCAPERAVAWSLSTLRLYIIVCVCIDACTFSMCTG